jgi:hypothetical protein
VNHWTKQLKGQRPLVFHPAALRITLNLDGAPITSINNKQHHYIGFILAFASSIHNKQHFSHHFKNTYSPITLTNISSIDVVFIFRCSSSTRNPVYVRRVDSSVLVFSLSSHRHSYIGLVFNSLYRLIINTFIFRCSSSTRNPVYVRRVDS